MKFLWLGIVLVAGASGVTQEALDCHLMPGWEQTGPARSYTPESLYDYKDGASEGYFQFGFVRMQGVDCKAGANTMAVDISEMTDAEMAYGMFTANRDATAPVAKIGMGGQVQPQSVLFARGKYFVELTVTDAAPEANFAPALQAFAMKLNERLSGSEQPPAILEVFPKEGLTDARLVPESVLGLRLLKRGYVAKYAHGQAFLVTETSPAAAAALMGKLREHFTTSTPAKLADEAFSTKVEYLDGVCIFRKGRYVAGYANLPDQAHASAASAKLLARLP